MRSCSTCVAIAISRGHLHCLQALLAQGPLQSEFLRVPSLRLQHRSTSFDFLSQCRSPCRAECPSRLGIASEEKSAAPSEFQCGHLRVSAANERELVENTKYSPFLAINVKYLALRSANPEIRTFCIQHFKMDPLIGLFQIQHAYYYLPDKMRSNVLGPLEVVDLSICLNHPTSVLLRSEYHDSISVLLRNSTELNCSDTSCAAGSRSRRANSTDRDRNLQSCCL